MPDKEIITLDGTRVDTLYATVEKGTKEDGTEYEKKQAVAPRTFSSAVTNADGTNLETKIAQILQRINELDGGEYDTLLEEIQDIQTEINNLDTAQDLEMIETQQALTEQDLDNIETQQTLTEQDLANIEGGLCNE